MVDLRQMRQFVAVAEELHFGRAAARLHMTQPPLTSAVQLMESQLGVTLFQRTRRSVALAPAGTVLLPIARRLLAEAQQIPDTLQAAAQGRLGQLRLGFVSTIGYAGLPAWLRGFRDQHPRVALSLREATLDVQLAAFATGEIDVGLVLHASGSPPSGFQSMRVLQEPLVLALPEEHPLVAVKRLPLARLLAEPLVMFPRAIAPSLYDALLSFYAAHRQSPRWVQEAIQMQTIVNLVSAGIGVAWVPESVMQLQRPGVVYRRIGTAAPRCETSLIWPLEPVPVAERFVEHVENQLRAAAALR